MKETRTSGMAPKEIDPDTFAQLVALITGDMDLSNADLAALMRDPATHACASELDAIWRLVGTLNPDAAVGTLSDT